AAFLFKGAPNDQCQAPHMGYVLKGKYVMRTADGVEEVFEAGGGIRGRRRVLRRTRAHADHLRGMRDCVFHAHRGGEPRTPRRRGEPHEVHARARDGSAGRTPAITTVGRGLGATRVRLEFAGLHPSERPAETSTRGQRTSVLPRLHCPRPMSEGRRVARLQRARCIHRRELPWTSCLNTDDDEPRPAPSCFSTITLSGSLVWLGLPPQAARTEGPPDGAGRPLR